HRLHPRLGRRGPAVPGRARRTGDRRRRGLRGQGAAPGLPARARRGVRAGPFWRGGPGRMSRAADAERDVAATDGHDWRLITRIPANPRRSLLWLPALGVAARHYIPFAEAMAARGVAVFLHEW